MAKRLEAVKGAIPPDVLEALQDEILEEERQRWRDVRKSASYKEVVSGAWVRKKAPQSSVEDRRYVPGALRHWRKVHGLSIRECQARIGYCNPPEAPIWMADLTFKPLGEIRVGDEVVGWAMPTDYAYKSNWGKEPAGDKRFLTASLQPTTVLGVSETHEPMVRVNFASGRWLRCTPTHLWLQHYKQLFGYENRYKDSVVRVKGGRSRRERFEAPRIGQILCQVVDVPTPTTPENAWLAGWLAGIFDGEGHVHAGGVTINQSTSRNPEIVAAIRSALETLGFDYTFSAQTEIRNAATIHIKGGRQAAVDFVNRVQPVRTAKLIEGTLGRQFRHPDEIVAIEPDGEDVALGMETTTGNYVAWGFASKNSERSCSWRHWEESARCPPYETLLRIIAATGLGYWVDEEGNGEVDPNLRLDILRSAEAERRRRSRAKRIPS